MRFFLSTLVVILAGCAGAGSVRSAGTVEHATTSMLPAELERVLRDYERAWIAKDAAALAELFTEDGFVLASNRQPVQGREAIRAAYAEAGGPLWLRALSHTTQGSVGYIVGVYGHDPNAPETGKFILALRRQDGCLWKIAADIDNSSQPPKR